MNGKLIIPVTAMVLFLFLLSPALAHREERLLTYGNPFNRDYSVSENRSEEVEKDEQDGRETSEKGENNGQNPLKPLTRFDMRLKYQSLDNGYNNWFLTLRMDKPIRLENKWTVALRIDMPLVWSDLPNPYTNTQNPEGNYSFGSSDLLTKVMFITPPGNRHSYGFGLQASFPTASDDQFGTGKYTAGPIIAGLYYPECLKKGSYAGVLIRNEFSYAGDDYRDDINQLIIQPAFNVNLPDRWFITIAPEIRLDWNSGRWFVPFDFMLGKLVTPSTVMSIEYKTGLVKDLPYFDDEVEFRTGFLF